MSVMTAEEKWIDCMLYAFEQAAEMIDTEEWSGDDRELQEKAFGEVAKRIRTMAKRYERKAFQ